MIGLFFEVEPKPGHADNYFDTAAALRPILDENGGVLFIDRYRSLRRSGVILSCQHWQDEAHLLAWRANQKHQGAQRAGREIHFADYRIRVAPAIDVADLHTRDRWIIAVHHSASDGAGLKGGETFESVYRESSYMTLFDQSSGEQPGTIVDRQGTATSVHAFSVDRDYTMLDRKEAPQSW